MVESLLNWGSTRCLITKPTVFLSAPKHTEFFIKVTFNIVIYVLLYNKSCIWKELFYIYEAHLVSTFVSWRKVSFSAYSGNFREGSMKCSYNVSLQQLQITIIPWITKTSDTSICYKDTACLCCIKGCKISSRTDLFWYYSQMELVTKSALRAS